MRFYSISIITTVFLLSLIAIGGILNFYPEPNQATLSSDEGKYGDKITNKEVCRVLKVSMRMIDRIKKRFVEEGFEACLERKPPSRTREPKADGELEARQTNWWS